MIPWLLKAFRWLRMSYQTVTNHWVPEVKKLNDNLEKLQDSLAGTDDCVMEIYALEERLEKKLELLEEDLTSVKAENTELKDHLKTVIKELNAITDGGIEDKLERLEELTAVKAQDGELRNHLNSTIKELNNIGGFLNTKYGDLIEQTYEIDSPLK